MRYLIVAALVLSSSTSLAQQPSPALAFLQESNGALAGCSRLVGETELASRLYGVDAPNNSAERGACVADAKERLRSAYSAYIASKPEADAKDSAKALYAANLALGDAIIDAASQAQLDDSQEQAEFRKARASFVIDAGL